MDVGDADNLLRKYLAGKCSREETEYVEAWLDNYRLENSASEQMSEQELAKYVLAVRSRLALSIDKAEKQEFRKMTPWYKSVYKAAAVLSFFVIAIALYLYSEKQNQQDLAGNKKPQIQDILPGGNKATLTLADGAVINLSDTETGVIASRKDFTVLKSNSGELVYKALPLKGTPASSTGMNTISTPNGGQYEVIIPDGTHVWLNAASSLKFPSAFTGNERMVELSGEAYFEVKKDKSKPFKVVFNQSAVEVLGTHFNIQTYKDEDRSYTSLLEGSIRIHSGKTSKLMEPGQQAVIGQDLKISEGDMEKAVAWKNGYFVFEETEDMKSIMRKIARWYDADIQYKGDITTEEFSFVGKISRNKSIRQVLNDLELTGLVHFKIDGRRVTVMP